jgi:hypothetical protein
VHRVRRPLGGDSNKEVIETVKISVVWTVWDSGYVERRSKTPSKRPLNINKLEF